MPGNQFEVSGRKVACFGALGNRPTDVIEGGSGQSRDFAFATWDQINESNKSRQELQFSLILDMITAFGSSSECLVWELRFILFYFIVLFHTSPSQSVRWGHAAAPPTWHEAHGKRCSQVGHELRSLLQLLLLYIGVLTCLPWSLCSLHFLSFLIICEVQTSSAGMKYVCSYNKPLGVN